MSFTASASTSVRRPQITTSAPSAAKRAAKLFPSPVPPPVTRIFWPLRRSLANIVVSLSCRSELHPSVGCGVQLQMMIGVAKEHFQHRRALEVRPDRAFLGDADSTVQLHSI